MKLLAFLLAAILTGCASRQTLIGIYDAPRAALPALRAAGFNLVTPAAGETNHLAYLNEARAAGIKVILSPALGSDAERRKTARLDKHPALWAWYLVDEPDLNDISPQSLRARKRLLRNVAGKQALIVVASGVAIEQFRDLAEIMAVDWYPVPWSPSATISREMRAARLAARGQPFIAILQAFDWAAFREMLVGDVQTRPPTREELRCMAFLSLFQGARHLMFYSYHTEKWKLPEHPQTWQAVTSVAAEARAAAPIFERRVPWWPLQIRYDSEQMYNEIEEGAVALAAFEVRQAKGATRPGYYFVAINTTDRPVRFSFRLPFREVAGVDSTCAPAGAALHEGWLSKEYAPFEVCIFGPINLKLILERLP